jgi:hypothetical protein
MYLPFTTPEHVADTLAAASAGAPDPRWLLCVADRHADAVPALLDVLSARGIRAHGGLFPGLIHGALRRDDGIVAIALPRASQVCRVDLGARDVRWVDTPPQLPGGAPASLTILVDSQSPGIAALLEDLYDRFADRVHHVGGGAGRHDLAPLPSIFTDEGLIEHAGLVVLVPRTSSVAVRHGWRRVRGPFVATRTRGNVIQELNWEPAGSFYRAQVEALAPRMEGRPVFPDLASSYPLCIGKEGGEDVMRDPMYISDADELVVLSDVPENSVMFLAHGDPDSLIESARQAVDDCGGVRQATSCFVSDCYSRALMLGDRFPRELAAVSAALAQFTDLPAEGVLALGEIAANGSRNLEFFNKTIVVAIGHA